MQHVLQISRKIDYGLRAMIHLAGLPAAKIASLQDLSVTLHIPREFLAKILNVLTGRGLVRSSRGAHGGAKGSPPAPGLSPLGGAPRGAVAAPGHCPAPPQQPPRRERCHAPP